MKGYFSKLAKQSGLHYANGNAASPAPDAEKRAGKLAPLHHEETVLVSPSATKNKKPDVTTKTETANVTAKIQMPEAVEEFSPQKDSPAVKTSVELAENKSLKPSEKSNPANREGVSGKNEQGEISVEAQPIEPEISNSAKSSALEQISFKEVETAEMIEKEPAETSGAQNFHLEQSLYKPENTTVEENSAKPEYFHKTAEILESGMADKLEIQQILLQEINEWVSAAPASGEREAENELKTEKESQPIFSTPAKDTPVRRQSTEDVSKNSDNLQEQNFDLSIGTITVVVEEPHRQEAQVAAKNQARAAEKPEAEKRGFSRLSRYYL